MALIFIGIPFVVRSVQPVLEKIDLQYEEAAHMLGANTETDRVPGDFTRDCPGASGGIYDVLCEGLGEYGSVVFIAGNTPYERRSRR